MINHTDIENIIGCKTLVTDRMQRAIEEWYDAAIDGLPLDKNPETLTLDLPALICAETITETLTDGTEQQKQVITETYSDIVNGALVTVEKVRTIAADGSETTTKAIKKASADSFSGLVKGWQEQADKGVLGTFSTLADAVKKQDWLSVGEWVLSTLYNGLAPEAKKMIDDLGKAIIQKVNDHLAEIVGKISDSLWNTGKELVNGLNKNGTFGQIADDVSKNGSVVIKVLGNIGTSMGGLVSDVGNGIAGLASSMGGLGEIATQLGSIFSNLGGLIIANPEIAAVIAIVAGIAGLGIALFSAFSRKTSDTAVSHYQSPFDKAGVYDSLSEFSTRAAMQYRVAGQAAENNAQLSVLERIEGLLDEHLPAIGTGQVVMDSGELVGVLSPRMATNVDARIGVTVERKARGV